MTLIRFRRHAAVVFVVGLAWGAATTAEAQAAEPNAGPAQASATPVSSVPIDPEGGDQWSVFFGYGFNQRLYDSAVGIDIAAAGVRWSHLWEAKGSGLIRGHPGLGLELVPVMSFIGSRRTTWAVGANLLYEHHFAVTGRVLPVWKGGIGLLYATQPVPAGVTKHNFSLMADFGVDITTSDRSAIFLGYRFHHVSNASTGELNPGINVNSLVFGLSFYR